MADFTTVMTDTSALDDSIIEEFDKQFFLAFAEESTVDQFVSYKRDIGAKSIEIPIYDQLALAITPLTEKEDLASEAMSDTNVLITPLEFGNVVTTTKLANLQTGGKADVAAARVVGINAGRSGTRLALTKADASANILYPGAVVAEAALVAGDVMDADLMGRAFNKLARASVPGLPSANGEYIMIAHDDVIHDIREGTPVGTWQDVHKYALPGEILKNEVGMFKGFRVIRNNLSTLNADGGAGTVDSYYSYFMGFNALGKAASAPTNMRVTGPFDKLARFLNVGWYGVYQYAIVQPEALWVGRSASSVGANT